MKHRISLARLLGLAALLALLLLAGPLAAPRVAQAQPLAIAACGASTGICGGELFAGLTSNAGSTVFPNQVINFTGTIKNDYDTFFQTNTFLTLNDLIPSAFVTINGVNTTIWTGGAFNLAFGQTAAAERRLRRQNGYCRRGIFADSAIVSWRTGGGATR